MQRKKKESKHVLGDYLELWCHNYEGKSKFWNSKLICMSDFRRELDNEERRDKIRFI